MGELEAPEAPKLRVAPPDPPLPTRERLCAMALETYTLALGATLTYKNAKGEEKSRPQPDFKGACECLKIAATIAGYIGAQPVANKPSRQALEAEREAEAIARGESLDAESALLRMKKRLSATVETE